MEDVLDDGSHFDGLLITPESRMYLAEIAKWAKFLSIVGFVFIGFMVLFGIFFGSIMGTMMGSMPEEMPSEAWAGMGGLMSFFYILMAALYFFPCYYLYKFANNTKAALANNDSNTLTDALENHKSVYKFWGILMIIMLGIYALGFIVAIIGGAASAF